MSKELVPAQSRGGDLEWADLRPVAGWLRSHKILLGAIVMIAVQLAWKGQFLGHLYFRQDDFHDLDLAVDHSFTWGYLTFIGSGHLIIGLRIIAWFLVRIASTPYDWLLASIVSMAFVAAAGAAAYRALRELFGERPAILVPLAIYLLTPLTMPDLGIWSSAMESVPLQLAMFMALTAHLRYVRTQRRAHLAWSMFWVLFGLIFFEKGLILPLLLFGVSAAFLTDSPTLGIAIFSTLRRYWRVWLSYLALMTGYGAVLMAALHTSASQPTVPNSTSGVLTFIWELLRSTFIPGSIGGPWKWFPVAGNSFAFAAPGATLADLSIIVAIAVVLLSIWLRKIAWRAWLILAVWVVVADMLPVIIGRVNFAPAILGLETRYVADATPALAICVGLAFLPVVAQGAAHAVPRERRHGPAPAQLQLLAAGLVGVFIFGSIWSVADYENVTNGTLARSYVTNARLAIQDARRDTPVVDRPVPPDIVEGTFKAYAYTSKVVGYLEQGALKGKLHWIGRPNGTVDGLMIFGPDGRLHLAQVYGAASPPRPGRSCWPEHHGKITIPFTQPSSGYSGALRIGYIWGSHSPGSVYIRYGSALQKLAVRPGLHVGYLPVQGSASRIVVTAPVGIGMCVGGAEAGNLVPATAGLVIPPLSSPAPTS